MGNNAFPQVGNFTVESVSGNNLVNVYLDGQTEPTFFMKSDTPGNILTVVNTDMNGSAVGNVTYTGAGNVNLTSNLQNGASKPMTLNANGTGTLFLTQENTGSTALNINSGAVEFSGNGSWGGTSGIIAGNIVDDGTLIFGGLGTANATTAGSGNQTMSAVISGTGSVQQIGTGTLTLSSTNTYAGSTTINAGAISINGNSSLGNNTAGSAAALIFSGNGTLALTASVTSVHNIVVMPV